MENLKLCDSEYRFMSLIWDAEPVTSQQLVELAAARLGWKKSTTYTVLKKLCERGFADNSETVVTSRIPRQQVQRFESNYFVDRAFSGSLPGFLAAFLGGKTISEREAQELMDLIRQHKEG